MDAIIAIDAILLKLIVTKAPSSHQPLNQGTLEQKRILPWNDKQGLSVLCHNKYVHRPIL